MAFVEERNHANIFFQFMSKNTIKYLICFLIGLSCIQCQQKMQDLSNAKIQFDTTNIDTNGLRNGEVAVDYEFCIPARDEILQQVLKIDPQVRAMKSSKGRIGCTQQQWLCINSTYGKGWKKKLSAIAALETVERIVETFYE